MANLITTGVLSVAIGVALIYLVRARRCGVKCVGCPHSGHCGKGGMEGGCGCRAAKRQD